MGDNRFGFILARAWLKGKETRAGVVKYKGNIVPERKYLSALRAILW